MDMQPIILAAKGITKLFPGVRALDEVSFTLRKGEIHALIGENGSGKSTLMKTIVGIYQADAGELELHGKPVHFRSPREALKNGLSMIHQEINLIPTMTVAENIWLAREKLFSAGGLLNTKKRDEAATELLERLELHIDPKAVVNTLSVANMQLVELARAISFESEIIIMDEPTSALTESEIKTLFKIVRDVSEKGTTIVFISHKIDEIFAVCDRVTILRDGRYICTRDCAELTPDSLIQLIVGHELKELFPKAIASIGNTVLSVENLSSTGVFKDISFSVKSGEILGVFGLMGAGRTEILRSVFGIDRYETGQVYLCGQSVQFKQPHDAIEASIGMVTEDRLRLGIIGGLPVRNNITISNLKKYVGRLHLLRPKKENEDCEQIMQTLNVKAASPMQTISSLSGGNQQKAIIGRWLLRNPKVFILDEPTRGIDVGSKSEIHRQISNLAQQGMAVIMISSELPEIMGMSDRILVVRAGEIVYTCDAQNADRDTLIKHAFGVVQ